MGSFDKIASSPGGRREGHEKDQALWADIRSGSRVAFAHLYNQHVQILYDYGKKIHVEDALIEDCIHDIFLDLWKYKNNIEITHSLKFYLLKSFRRKLFQKLRQTRRFDPAGDNNEHLLKDTSPSYQDKLIEDQALKEKTGKVKAYIELLTRRQKEVIYLRFYQNLSYEEISSIMKVGVDSAYNLVSKAIARLKKHI